MRSNGNCRGVSYWESHTGYLHTGDTVRHRLQSTALNQLDIGEAQHRWSCSTIGAPFEPDPVVSVRGLDSKSSLQPAGISRCTSNPGFSRSKSDFLFFFFCFSAQKSFEGKEGGGLEEEFGEKRERQRKRKRWQERERKGGGRGRGIRRVEKKKKKEEKRKRNNRERERESVWRCAEEEGQGRRTRTGKDWNCGCGGNAIHGGRGTDRYTAAESTDSCCGCSWSWWNRGSEPRRRSAEHRSVADRSDALALVQRCFLSAPR